MRKTFKGQKASFSATTIKENSYNLHEVSSLSQLSHWRMGFLGGKTYSITRSISLVFPRKSFENNYTS